MDWAALATGTGTLIVAIGLAVTWRRNGSHQAERDMAQAKLQAARDAILARNQEAILERLDNKEHGLQAVNEKVAAQALHCAQISGPLVTRVNGHDREIRDLKARPHTP